MCVCVYIYICRYIDTHICIYTYILYSEHRADKLLAVSHGYLNMVLYDHGIVTNVEGTSISTLHPGDMIGETALLGRSRLSIYVRYM